MLLRKGFLITGVCASLALMAPLASGSLIYAGITGGQSSASGLSNATNLGLMAGISIPLIPFLYVEGQYQRIHSWHARIEGAAAVLRVPLAPRVAILGKIGGAHLSGISNGVATSGSGLLYGAGLSVRIYGPIAVRGEYQVIRVSGVDYRTAQGDLIYHF